MLQCDLFQVLCPSTVSEEPSSSEETVFDKSMKTFGELVVLGVLILRFECKINYLYILKINSLCVMDALV